MTPKKKSRSNFKQNPPSVDLIKANVAASRRNTTRVAYVGYVREIIE